MSIQTDSRIASTAKELVVARDFDAPRGLVFKAWTDPGLLARWWAPNGFTTPSVTVDLRVGGVFHSCMRAPDGPFPEAHQLIAGFWIFDTASREEAVEWVTRCPNPLKGEAEIEIRQVF